MNPRNKSRKSPESLQELPPWPETVMGGKYVRLLEKQLQELRAKESAHGNRALFLDDVFVAYLLAFFNPTIRSLRTIEDFSQTRQAQKHLSLAKVCRSTLSDFNRLADPTRLQPVLQALRQQLSRQTAGATSDDLSRLLQHTIAVDGTFLPAIAEVAWATRRSRSESSAWQARVDMHVSVETWLPELIVIPEPQQSESSSAATHVQDGRIYLYDRGYSGFEVMNAHYQLRHEQWESRAHFLIRYKPAGGNAPELKEAPSLPLRSADTAAGVVSDRVGKFQSSKPSRHHVLDVTLREVLVEYRDAGELKTLRIITNLLDVSAAVIAQLYRFRWQIELFFRWLKCFGNFSHMISYTREGVLLHFYVAVIAAMLMYLHTGYRPSKYLFVLLSQVAGGGATGDEIMPILRERERQRDLERQSAAKRRAKKKSQER